MLSTSARNCLGLQKRKKNLPCFFYHHGHPIDLSKTRIIEVDQETNLHTIFNFRPIGAISILG